MIYSFGRAEANAIDLSGGSGNIHASASTSRVPSYSSQPGNAPMIDLHYWTTPNGHKITMFLEETGLALQDFPGQIGKGEQFKPEFLAIAPNNRIPAMVDHEPKGGGKPISIFESGAMLLYLAEKTGKFLPADLYGRYDAIQWTFWQMGGLGPMAGQNHHFRNYARGKDQIRHRPLRERDQPALRRAQQAPRRPRIHRRRLFDRRHGELSLDRALQEPGTEHRRLPASEALAGNHPRRGPPPSAPTPWRKRSIRISASRSNRTEEERRMLFGQTAAVVR